jgi:hypothetical protein
VVELPGCRINRESEWVFETRKMQSRVEGEVAYFAFRRLAVRDAECSHTRQTMLRLGVA